MKGFRSFQDYYIRIITIYKIRDYYIREYYVREYYIREYYIREYYIREKFVVPKNLCDMLLLRGLESIKTKIENLIKILVSRFLLNTLPQFVLYPMLLKVMSELVEF